MIRSSWRYSAGAGSLVPQAGAPPQPNCPTDELSHLGRQRVA